MISFAGHKEKNGVYPIRGGLGFMPRGPGDTNDVTTMRAKRAI